MKTNKNLIVSGILFTLVLFLWPVFMSISQPQGAVAEQLQWIQNNSVIYKLQFFFAFLISPSIIYMMISQLNKYPLHNIASKLGLIFLSAYLVLNSISYASQIILVPQLIKAGLMEQASIWYFGSLFSVSYFVNQMGYCFWSIAALLLFLKLMKEKGMIKYLSMIYVLSALLSIIAFIGLIVDNTSINSMTFYSGMVLIPTGIMTTIWGIQENKKEKEKAPVK